MTAFREVELKLELDPALRPGRRVRSRLPVGGETRHLASLIFDTADHALAGRGLVLRVRRDGDRRVQTLKAPAEGGLLDRLEWEAEIEGDEPDLSLVADQGLRDWIAAAGPLAPVLETEFDRTTWRIERDGSVLELALDVGTIRAGTGRVPIHEIEIELKAGDVLPVFALGREIAAALPARLGLRSKSERGYGLLEPPSDGAVKARTPALSPGMSAGEAFQVIARGCLRHFRANEDGIGRGEAESLHQARVALRRMRVCLKLFRPLVAGPERDRLARDVARVSRLLGQARNLDVFLGRTLPREAAASPVEPGLPELRDAVARERDAAYATVVRRLRFRSARLLLLDLSRLVECGAWLSDEARAEQRARPIADAAADLLATGWGKVRRKRNRPDRLDEAGRHRLRLRCKALRYAAEFFTDAFPGRKAGKRQRRFVLILAALQDSLGELNDLRTARELSSRLAARGGAAEEKDVLLAASHVTGQEDSREPELLARARKAHRRLRRAEPFWA